MNNFFRPMRRIKQQLSERESIEILKTEKRGVLAVYGENGYPYAFPMNFIYNNNKIYFHCAKEGHKIDALIQNNKVSFCIMDKGIKKEGDWAYYVKSVIIFGTIRKIENNNETISLLRTLAQKYFPTQQLIEDTIKKHAGKVQMLELNIDHITGKLVHER